MSKGHGREHGCEKGFGGGGAWSAWPLLPARCGRARSRVDRARVVSRRLGAPRKRVKPLRRYDNDLTALGLRGLDAERAAEILTHFDGGAAHGSAF